MIFSFASLVTHSLFRTDPRNMTVNNASSYLDLSPLYGDSAQTLLVLNYRILRHLALDQVGQDKVRDKASGRGLLYPDTFSEERLMFLPPASSVLLVLFSRNHNVCSRFRYTCVCEID
jgi:linoleate 10R-lipoxygenase